MYTPSFLNACSLFLLASIFDLSTATNTNEIVVRRGEKIQDAINRANNYTRIIIERGIYNEQLVIQKDGIELIGKPMARLFPPTTYTDNICTGIAGNTADGNGGETKIPSQNGICVIGDVTLFPYAGEHQRVDTVRHRVKDVKISGLEVRNFTGMNIAVVAGLDTLVDKNQLYGGQKYGFLTLGSINTKFEKNGIHGVGPAIIGVCNDDKSDVKIWNNEVDNYFVGLCIQTNGADVRGNHVSQACYGAFVDPFVDGALVRWNHIRVSAAYCPYFSVPHGINVAGGVNTEVRWNYVQEIKALGINGVKGVGIGVHDFIQEASGNKIRDNFLKMNDLDIQVDAKGAGNVVKNNQCYRSDPAGYCKLT